VIDGDTVDVSFPNTKKPTTESPQKTTNEHRERIRLIGIDTPETKKPDTPVECFGKEASASLAALLPKGTNVRIERDVEERDRYGRLLGYIFRAQDGLFVNLEMVRAGMALPLTFPPNVAYTDQFLAAGDAARNAHVGLWTACQNGHDSTTAPT
jgi:micrococcal nuclease